MNRREFFCTAAAATAGIAIPDAPAAPKPWCSLLGDERLAYSFDAPAGLAASKWHRGDGAVTVACVAGTNNHVIYTGPSLTDAEMLAMTTYVRDRYGL